MSGVLDDAAEPWSDQICARIRVEERDGIVRENEPVRISIPIANGVVHDLSKLCLTDNEDRSCLKQLRVLERWPDKSIKWLLCDFRVTLEALEIKTLHVRHVGQVPEVFEIVHWVHECDQYYTVDTGAAHFVVPKNGTSLIQSAHIGSADLIDQSGLVVRLTDDSGLIYFGIGEHVSVEEQGALRSTIAISGRFEDSGSVLPVRFMARITFFADRGAIEVELGMRNPMAARHPQNLWDLGDSGSYCYKDLSIDLRLLGKCRSLRWYSDVTQMECPFDSQSWALYQDSSGGENWMSKNHLNAEGESSVRFRGFQVHDLRTSESVVIANGLRATPCVVVDSDSGWIAASIKEFWQNFPKALRCNDGVISLGLFPSESSYAHELQGGERKRHVVLLDFGKEGQDHVVRNMQKPLHAYVDAPWIERCGVIPHFLPEADGASSEYSNYINSIIDGPNSFVRNREIIDEYGWRNFGETYADHEAVGSTSVEPLISHYNNQYDFLNAACVHYLRTGSAHWRQLMLDAAGHLIDIDIYHTTEDRAVFNGGMFWHTDHYVPAATCTHRTYSQENGTGPLYGGGPSNEHNYTTGLRNYYYLTGDIEAKHAVIKLADWVIAMDAGADSILAFVDSRDTGYASKTVNLDYHKPGRGAGNSINALLDAYMLSNSQKYIDKAEVLIRRCIHPADDISSLGLDEPEHRWSYLVFLQVLGNYLDVKVEFGAVDCSFFFARDALLHYASWILENEVPYKDVLHKVNIPTETWPAQDIRKCNILHVAAKFTSGEARERFSAKAEFFFDRCISDLQGFETAYLSRPRVILAAFGYVNVYFRKHGYNVPDHSILVNAHNFEFGCPKQFVPQHPIARKLTKKRCREMMRRLISRANNRARRVVRG